MNETARTILEREAKSYEEYAERVADQEAFTRGLLVKQEAELAEAQRQASDLRAVL